jgi:plastocyanin
MPVRRVSWPVAASLALAAVLTLGTGTPAAGATVTVTIDGMRFQPERITARRGDTLVWVNRDLVPHTATVAGGFDSGPIQPGAQWRGTVPAPGRHEVRCTLHPTMKAMLVIE